MRHAFVRYGKERWELPGAIRLSTVFRLEVQGQDTLVIRLCKYLRPRKLYEIPPSVSSDRRVRVLLRSETDTTRMEYVRRILEELERWVEKAERGEPLEPVRVPLPETLFQY